MIRITHRENGNLTPHESGRTALESAYREETGRPLPPIRKTASGKPFFADDPLHFSISHTKHHAFCALSDNPVGIDAEELDRNIDLRLADKILSPAEKAQFDAAQDRRLALLTFWVLKEAYVKFTGTGLQRYPSFTNFSLDDPRVTVQNGCLLAVIQGE